MSVVTATTPPRTSALAMSIRQNRGFYGAILLLAAHHLAGDATGERHYSADREV